MPFVVYCGFWPSPPPFFFVISLLILIIFKKALLPCILLFKKKFYRYIWSLMMIQVYSSLTNGLDYLSNIKTLVRNIKRGGEERFTGKLDSRLAFETDGVSDRNIRRYTWLVPQVIVVCSIICNRHLTFLSEVSI
jgi:hypothetical protein